MTALSKAIKEAAHRGEQIYLQTCTVDSVNESERTIECTPLDEGAQLTGVQLQAVTDERGGLCMFPKVGSYVVVGFFDRHNAAVLLSTEIEKITINVNDTVCIKNEAYSLAQAFRDLLTAIGKLTVTTGVGPSGVPINVTEFQQIQQKLDKLLE
ncbi:MAG: hypothetical protein LBU90_10470 [Bacteroidales bacterium]|jgi:hypothetical protein|nr:hypothetical protein [Bacteroidales bacterium]